MSNVYILKCTDGTYKVGKADNITQRKPNVDREYNVESEIYAWKPITNAYKFETYMHNVLRKYRTTGEFFKIPQPLLDELVQKHCFILSVNTTKSVVESKINFPYSTDQSDDKGFLANISHFIVKMKSEFWLLPKGQRAGMLDVIESLENVYSLY